jgi:hypothetical protein
MKALSERDALCLECELPECRERFVGCRWRAARVDGRRRWLPILQRLVAEMNIEVARGTVVQVESARAGIRRAGARANICVRTRREKDDREYVLYAWIAENVEGL